MLMKNEKLIRFLDALVVLALSAVALVSATYAWFGLSGEVTVSNVSLTASAPQNIEIRYYEGVDGEGADIQGANDDWQSDLDFTNIINALGITGKLYPASTISATDDTFYRALGVDSMGAAVSTNGYKYEELTGDRSLAGSNNGYYFDIPLQLRSTQAESYITLSRADSVIESYFGENLITDADAKKLSKAIRVAFLNPATDGAAFGRAVTVDDKTATGNQSLNTNYIWTGQSGDSLATVSSQSQTVVSPNILNDDSVLLYLAAPTSGTVFTPSTLIARVWIEGEAPDAVKLASGQTILAKLVFVNAERD